MAISQIRNVLEGLVLQGRNQLAVGAELWSESEWEQLRVLAQQNTLLLRLASRLEECGVRAPNDFQEAVRSEEQRIREVTEVIQQLSDICRESATIFVLTKAFQHQPDMGHDIDLFVLDEGRDIDRLIGRKIHLSPGKDSFVNWISEKSAFQINGYSFPLEIHHGRLGQLGEYATYARQMAQNRRLFEKNGVSTFVPSPEDQLIIQVLQRIYGHGYLRLGDAACGLRLLQAGLDWDYIYHSAGKFGILDGTLRYLSYLGHIAAASTPAPPRGVPLNGVLKIRPPYFDGKHYRFSFLRGAPYLFLKKTAADVKAGDWSGIKKFFWIPAVAAYALWRSLWATSMRRIYAATVLTEWVILMSGIYVYRLTGIHLGQDGFSQYLLGRRSISLLLPLLMLSIDTGLARHLPMSGRAGEGDKKNYFFGALLAVSFMGIIIGAVGNIFNSRLTYLVYGSHEHAFMAFPITLLLIGIALQQSCYSYYQGTLAMLRGNWLQLVSYGIVPAVAVQFFGTSSRKIMVVMAAGFFSCAWIALWDIGRGGGVSLGQAWKSLKRLAPYSLPRVPGVFGLMGLLHLPAIFVAHAGGLRQAGYTAFGIAILTMVSSVIYPFRIILLPEASGLIIGGHFEELRRRVRQIFLIIMPVALGLTILLQVAAPFLIRNFFDARYLEMTAIIRIMALGVPAYALHLCLRSIIDAYHDSALNTKNILAAFGVFLGPALLSVKFENSWGVIGAFVGALYLLGFLTYKDAIKIFQQQERP